MKQQNLWAKDFTRMLIQVNTPVFKMHVFGQDLNSAPHPSHPLLPHVSLKADMAVHCCSWFSLWRFCRTPNAAAAAAAAGIMFCQMQQLCSLTSMSWLQSLQLLWSPPTPPPAPTLALPHCNNQSVSGNDEQYTCCVCFIISAPVFKKCCTVPLGNIQLNATARASSHFLHNAVGLILMFSLHFLAASDNQLEVTQLLIVWDFLFSISGAHVLFLRLKGIFDCAGLLKKTK